MHATETMKPYVATFPIYYYQCILQLRQFSGWLLVWILILSMHTILVNGIPYFSKYLYESIIRKLTSLRNKITVNVNVLIIIHNLFS